MLCGLQFWSRRWVWRARPTERVARTPVFFRGSLKLLSPTHVCSCVHVRALRASCQPVMIVCVQALNLVSEAGAGIPSGFLRTGGAIRVKAGEGEGETAAFKGRGGGEHGGGAGRGRQMEFNSLMVGG